MGWFRKRQTTDVVETLQSVLLRLGAVEGHVEKLQNGHASLRGFVYAKLSKQEESQKDNGPAAAAGATGTASPPASREELRRSLVTTGRFVPGRPARHD